jgi:hypothetical protein
MMRASRDPEKAEAGAIALKGRAAHRRQNTFAP